MAQTPIERAVALDEVGADVLVSPGRRVRLEAEGDVPYQVDGDPAGALPVEVEVLDRKARFLVP